MSEMLLREGDDLVARGDFNGALNRYDRAQVLRMNDPIVDYRIATVLDKQLRPIEAQIRYQLFLHKLELEDPCFIMERHATTNETVIRGLGELHMRTKLEKMVQQEGKLSSQQTALVGVLVSSGRTRGDLVAVALADVDAHQHALALQSVHHAACGGASTARANSPAASARPMMRR